MKILRKSWLYFVIPALIALVASLSFVQSAQAVEFDDDGIIAADEVIDDDVFISAENVVVDGTVNGDLFAAGSSVVVNGIVRGSLVAAGQTILVNGTVEGSLYAGASAIELGSSASIGRNMYAGGFSVVNKSGSQVGRDMLVGGYQVQASGDIGRDLRVGTAALEISGSVGGDVNAEVGDPTTSTPAFPAFFAPPGAPAMIPPGLRISSEAEIGGELTYTSELNQSGSINSQPEGGIVFQTPVPDQREEPSPRVSIELQIGRWLVRRLRDFLTLLALGALAIWLIPNLLDRWTQRVADEPLPSGLWGLISILVGYAGSLLIGLIILAVGLLLGVVTLGGLSRTVFGVGFSTLGFAFTIFTLFVSYGSKVIVAILGGRLILERLAPTAAENRWLPLVLGVSIYVLLRSIFLLGPLFGFFVTLLGLGAVVLVFRMEGQPALRVVAPTVE